MLHGRMVYIPEEGRAAGVLYGRPAPVFGSEGNTERFIREGAASDKRGQGNSLSTHQFILPRKEPAAYRVITRKSWKWIEF